MPGEGIYPCHAQPRSTLKPLIYSVPDTGVLLSRSHWNVRKLFREGRLRGVRINGRLMFRASEIERFLTESETTYEPNDNSVGARFQDRAIAARRKIAARKRRAA